jgi:hypothetical protein
LIRAGGRPCTSQVEVDPDALKGQSTPSPPGLGAGAVACPDRAKARGVCGPWALPTATVVAAFGLGDAGRCLPVVRSGPRWGTGAGSWGGLNLALHAAGGWLPMRACPQNWGQPLERMKVSIPKSNSPPGETLRAPEGVWALRPTYNRPAA